MNESKKYNYDASKVKVKVDTNCAKSVVCCIRYAGINVGDFYTGNEVEVCEKTGAFDILKDDKYCKSSDYLLEGDILVTRTSGHTVVVLTDGPKAKEYLPYKVWNCAYANLRKGPSINYGNITALSSGTLVRLYGWAETGWGYIEVDGLWGYMSPMYLEPCQKALVSGGSTWLRDNPGKDIGKKIISIPAGSIVYLSGKTAMIGNTVWYNVFFKGYIDKKYVPYVLSKSNLNILNLKPAGTQKYGNSSNKLFEYFAAGNPVIANIDEGKYPIISKYRCGIVVPSGNPQKYAEGIKQFYHMSEAERKQYSENAINTVHLFDTEVLNAEWEKIISNLLKANNN